MIRYHGEEQLIKQAEHGFPKGVSKITEGVYFALGFGGSNAILVEGQSSCLLIDTLNGCEVAQEALTEFQKITTKPIKTIIFTHFHHFDHTSGAGVFANDDCEIIARAPSYPQYGKSHLLKDIAGIRGARQFGAGLTPEEVISVGIGPRNNINSSKCVLPPTRLFSEEKLSLTIDGIPVLLVAAPGETDDQLFVWLPDHGVLCCGDNYYHSFPNLYPIRGGQYRDINAWIGVLDNMLAYDIQYLLPGHSQAIIGHETIKHHLTTYREALNYVLEETLKGMNEGLTMDQLVETVKLPAHLVHLPHLQEYYGTVAWSVRAIYTGYLGWFDGNPTKLGQLPIKTRAEKTLDLMGGAPKVLQAAQEAFQNQDEQWTVELCDILLDAQQLVSEAKLLKAQGLMNLGRLQTSANGRHYYIAYAKELMGENKLVVLNGAANDMTIR